MHPSHSSPQKQLPVHPLTTSLSSSSLGPWQLGQAPTSSHYLFFHQSQEDQLGNWRAQVSQLTLVSHAVCPALSHKDGVPMCSPIGTTHLSGAWWCSQQPLGTLWQWGSSPWLPSGRHCWRCRDLLSPE